MFVVKHVWRVLLALNKIGYLDFYRAKDVNRLLLYTT